MDHASPQQQHLLHQATPEQQLSHQQLVIDNLSARLVSMEEKASVTAAEFEQRLAAATNHISSTIRYKPTLPRSLAALIP
jgi:hypothetical protein